MGTGNVLVLGNSGVGKSTLINAVLGANVAITGWGTHGTTKKLEIYESADIPFRVIDSIGFEPGFINRKADIDFISEYKVNPEKAIFIEKVKRLNCR